MSLLDLQKHPALDPMERVLSRSLREVDERRRLEVARQTVEQLGSRFDPDVCSLLIRELAGSSNLEGWAGSLADTANGAWLRTQLLSDSAALTRAWEQFLSFGIRRDPLDLLAWARALAGTGAYEEAAQKLRRLLSDEIRYEVFCRAGNFVEQLSRSVTSYVRRCKIAILGSSTTSLLIPILQALCLRDQIGVEIYEAPYGSVEQEIRDAESGLTKFRPDIVIISGHWHELNLSAITANEASWIDEFVEERKADWKRLSDSLSCHVIQSGFDYPDVEAYGYLACVLQGGRTRVIDLLNLRLQQEAGRNVSIVDMAAVQRYIGIKGWEDNVCWNRYRQHPALGALPAVGEAYMSHVRALLGLSRKVLVTDLDNTLWHGVIGEDGLDGIGIGPGDPYGEAYLGLQNYLLDLKRRGILLAVCSKNNIEDAQLPFARHPHMALRLEDFAVFRANWKDKATNLREISRQLSLGLDSFVFLDDNPLEREWVRSQLPEVAVVELGDSPFNFLHQLNRGRYFEALSLSGEDLGRANQYRLEGQREILRSSSASLDDFLQKLQLQAVVEEITEKNLTRVTQLVNKTNQFNLTTRRYTEAQLRAMVDDPSAWARAFQLSDRMASYGLVGVMFCRSGKTRHRWTIDTWLMSCRALGRQMEKFMFDRLIEAAMTKDIRVIEGMYCPTARNELVKELYDRMGFRRIGGSADHVRYEFDVPGTAPVTATHIRDMTTLPEGRGHGR